MISLRQALMGGAATCAVVIAATPAFAEVQAFDIPAQPARTAIQEFGRQSGLQILASQADVGDQRVDALKGEYEPREALRRLLIATNLRVASDDGRTVTLAPQSGSAAGDGADQGTVQALIVTAQKREENIQDVPIAMSAFSQEDLTRSQVAGGPDLMTQVPNMTFTKTNFSSYSIQIRGIGTQAISATVDPAVAVAFNNTPFVRNRFFEQEFYDLERVEVLRGPQGTLYGRNATAGVVNILSAKPKFIYESRLSADISNYSSSRLEGMINLPLADDKVALRLAGAWTKREGYVTNEITGNPIDGRDLWSTRLSLRFAPTDKLEANLIWEHFEEDDDRLRSGKQLCHKDVRTEVAGLPVPATGQFPGSQPTFYQSQLSQGCLPASLYSPDSFETPNGYQFAFYHALSAIGLPVNPTATDPYVSNFQSRDLRVIESTVDPEYKAKNDTLQVQVRANLTDALSLTSETAWASDFIFSTQDYNRFNTQHGAWADSDPRPNVLNDGVFCDPQIGCSDRLVAVDLSTAKSRHFSQEFRLASDFEGSFNFSLGANFLRYDTEDKYYVFINALSLFAASSFATDLTTPYMPGVSDNRECLPLGLQTVDPSNLGIVSTAHNCVYMDPNPIGALNDLGHNYFLSKNPYKLISYAMFGEAYYQISDDLKLTAGLRWTVDRKEAPRIPSWIITPDNVGYPVLEVVSQEWREPTGRLTVDWKPDLRFTDETLFYASYAHGYKAGGANPPPAAVALNVNTGGGVPSTSDTHPTKFDAEYVNAVEVGSKNTLLDGLATLNLAGFYYDYKGYQLSQIVDRSAITKNFDAQVWGLEVEADWRVLENLKLGLKGGYENTQVADGMSAVDVMDRTAGHSDWIVVKPFPVYPSNCIVPAYLSAYDGSVHQIGNVGGSFNGPCNMAYFDGLDPITSAPYVANPVGGGPNHDLYFNGGFGAEYPNYPGFDPSSAPNNGEGFSKDLSGHELPNAPHFTATITADYTLPLPSNWLMTLHTDLYYQSEAWTRIFNTPGYDKLKAYTNVNLAAIFTNEEAGWRVMAYVKNVMDRDSITGAFLNSDDSGLTTNVFLTEPRLYGLRVTKEWSGGPWWTGASASHTPGEPYPLTVEIGGQVQRHDARNEPLRPPSATALSAALDTFGELENSDLDRGDGREAKIKWRPAGGAWAVSLGARFGRTNGASRRHSEELSDPACAFAGPQACASYPQYYYTQTNFSDVQVARREEFQLVDFSVGREAGIGGLSRSSLSAGLRYAQFKSSRSALVGTVPHWDFPAGWYGQYVSSFNQYDSDLKAEREFKGAGPILSWEASQKLIGGDDVGHVDLDWSLTGGVLFGKNKLSLNGVERTTLYEYTGYQIIHTTFNVPPISSSQAPVSLRRSNSATVPILDVSLGLSYEVERMKVSTGYRWERYFNVLDGGQAQSRDVDRTIDGPYFKIAVGFGG